MHACRQTALPPPNCGCRILSLFFADATIEFPFCVNPSLRPLCPLGNGAEVVSQAIARMDRDTPLPNPSVNKFDICPHFAPSGGCEVLEKVELSERRFMEGQGNKERVSCWISRHISPFIRQKRAICSTSSSPGVREEELLFSRKGH